MPQSLINYTLHLADNALILAHRNSEWTGHGPILEQDIAISNIALDLIGQARNLYQYAAELIGNGATEDSLAYLRDATDFKNFLLVEQEKGDWAVIFERDKQEKLTEIYDWTEKYSFLKVNDELLQQTSRYMYDLYESTKYEAIRSPFLNVNHDFQLGINESIATKNSYTSELDRQIQEKQALLKDLQDKKDPDPPYQRSETKEARKLLQDAGHSF